MSNIYIISTLKEHSGINIYGYTSDFNTIQSLRERFADKVINFLGE